MEIKLFLAKKYRKKMENMYIPHCRKLSNRVSLEVRVFHVPFLEWRIKCHGLISLPKERCKSFRPEATPLISSSVKVMRTILTRSFHVMNRMEAKREVVSVHPPLGFLSELLTEFL